MQLFLIKALSMSNYVLLPPVQAIQGLSSAFTYDNSGWILVRDELEESKDWCKRNYLEDIPEMPEEEDEEEKNSVNNNEAMKITYSDVSKKQAQNRLRTARRNLISDIAELANQFIATAHSTAGLVSPSQSYSNVPRSFYSQDSCSTTSSFIRV